MLSHRDHQVSGSFYFRFHDCATHYSYIIARASFPETITALSKMRSSPANDRRREHIRLGGRREGEGERGDAQRSLPSFVFLGRAASRRPRFTITSYELFSNQISPALTEASTKGGRVVRRFYDDFSILRWLRERTIRRGR